MIINRFSYTFLIVVALVSCGSSDSGSSKEKDASPTTTPIKWQQFQINTEVSACTSSALDSNPSLSYSVAFSRCSCLFDYFARKYTYDEMAANAVPYLKEAQDNGTVAECQQRFP